MPGKVMDYLELSGVAEGNRRHRRGRGTSDGRVSR